MASCSCGGYGNNGAYPYSASVAAVGNPALAGGAVLAATSGVMGVPVGPGAPAMMARIMEPAFASPPVWAVLPYSPATIAVTTPVGTASVAGMGNAGGGGGGGAGTSTQAPPTRPPILAEADGAATRAIPVDPSAFGGVTPYGFGVSSCGCCPGGAAYSPLPPAGFAAWGEWARRQNAPIAELLGCPGKW